MALRGRRIENFDKGPSINDVASLEGGREGQIDDMGQNEGGRCQRKSDIVHLMEISDLFINFRNCHNNAKRFSFGSCFGFLFWIPFYPFWIH